MSLDASLIAAHDAGDASALIGLYAEAADGVDGEARAFFLTHAWVFALESGDARASDIEARLREMGRA